MNITWSLPGHSGGGAIDRDVLETPLPAGRASEDAGLCFGHYVHAVESLLHTGEAGIIAPLARSLSLKDPSAVISVHVAILKHGHFYHPACMTLFTDTGEYPFVINLAVTPEGGACAEREFTLLGHLESRSPALPHMQVIRRVSEAGQEVVLFVGEWFQGYHEFHQTRGKEGAEVVVWADQEHCRVSRAVEVSIYRQVAAILTRLYNPLTFELVQPWHHAAGDFVVNIDGAAPLVKLITVRQYTPMCEVEEVEAEDLLEGAFFFLMLLSLRNRLDRFDGIGEVSWVGSHSVGATLDGFFDGLEGVEDVGPLNGAFGEWVRGYLASHTEADFYETACGVVASFNPRATEMGAIREGIADHVAQFYVEIQKRKNTAEVKKFDPYVH